MAGIGSVAFTAACNSEPQKTLYSLVQAPDDQVTGRATWYASTCRECPAGCGILAKNREGRVIKVEGNPLHPINQGKLCIRGQASLQGIYHPARITTPLLKAGQNWHPIPFSQAHQILKQKTVSASKRGPNRVRFISETVGRYLAALFREALAQWNSDDLCLFEPFGYESSKTAHKLVFGIEGLPRYSIDRADTILSFGADFLETWLSPVEYARQFKQMHALQNGRKGVFFHASPFQSLTGANADLWLPCHPGAEAVIALGLIRALLARRKGQNLPPNLRQAITRMSAPYGQNRVIQTAGLDSGQYQALIRGLMNAQAPLILGTNGCGTSPHALQTNIAVNLLNLVLNPELPRHDFQNRHHVETAAKRSEVLAFFEAIQAGAADVVLLNNVNPAFVMPSTPVVKTALGQSNVFAVSFSNFMDETSALADLILPVRLPLETWDEYGGQADIVSLLQPTMGKMTQAPTLGDVFLKTAFTSAHPAQTYSRYLYNQLVSDQKIHSEAEWLEALQRGGVFKNEAAQNTLSTDRIRPEAFLKTVEGTDLKPAAQPVFLSIPSIRFFDGRGANKPWLCEIPDPLTKIAWQTPILMHPRDLKQRNLEHGDLLEIASKHGKIKAPVYETIGVRPGTLAMAVGQGHANFEGSFQETAANPFRLLPADTNPESGEPYLTTPLISIAALKKNIRLAHTDGSRVQHGRKIALFTTSKALSDAASQTKSGLAMDDFPLTLPLMEGYNAERDIYPPHPHKDYRWGMVVDLDKCVGCGACAAACYAENNVGVVGRDRIIEGREMAWLQIQRYHDPNRMQDIIFFPMMCQHCDSAPCEPVCPVYAPHHSKEGINNQIYNRCIGTRFCAQNCPYKVRRFNWFEWQFPDPLQWQLNPDVTVRSKGVMEKCSFCIQRIKAAHGDAKNENRKIRDGEVTPACVQTCPTGALVFGNMMDPASLVRKLTADPRAYQAMGYLNTKPAVIYLKKVRVEI
ncbi:MAG: molybdopterin dinucleotide binding domain-containing protein [Desulfobacterales bacterium]